MQSNLTRMPTLKAVGMTYRIEVSLKAKDAWRGSNERRRRLEVGACPASVRNSSANFVGHLSS